MTDAATLASNLVAELSDISGAAKRISLAQTRGSVTRKDLERSIEGLTLASHVSFEGFIRELFISCVEGTSSIPGVHSRLQRVTRTGAAEIVTGDSRYVDWLPLRETQARAYRFLANGLPFSRLAFRTQTSQNLDELHVVRNRIAHSGEEARARYEKSIMQSDLTFSEPSRWLMHEKNRVSNLERILARLQLAAQVLGSDNPDIDAVLEKPAKAAANQHAPGGRYQCLSCGSEVRSKAPFKLPECTCSGKSWLLTKLYRR